MGRSQGSDEKPKSTIDDTEAQTGTVEEIHQGFWAKTRTWAGKIGVEEFGIEPIPSGMRTNQHPRELFTFFFAANCNMATLATGYLATTTYALGWWDSFLCILFFNLLGGLLPGLAAVLGPKLGLRTMIIPRYFFGWWPAKIFAILNIINQLGWGVVNGISGAVVLYDVGDGRMPLSVSVLVLGLVAMILGLLGYRVIHIYDKYSWPVFLVSFIIVAGFGARHFANVPMGSGALEAADVLSFSTAIIGFQAAWMPLAADYGVYMKENISGWTSFGWAYGGLVSSQVLMELLGAAIGTLSLSDDPLFTDAYESGGIGGLIGAVFKGMGSGVEGFGKFLEVLLALSTVAVIITNVYSVGLAVQMVSTKLLFMPRFAWSLLGSVVFLACAIAGREYLSEVMEDFLLVCAYWIVPFGAVFLTEQLIFRRGYAYDITAWSDSTRLPYGIAASVTWIIGTVLSILCMSQTWWIGPIAAAIPGSPYGTDISWILAFSVCTIIYIPLRRWEQKSIYRGQQSY
ncbi:NCS1 nucleoside transporter [Seiridium cupressi]